MTEEPVVGRAQSLGALLKFAADDQVAWRAVESAGQGIALYAFSNRSNASGDAMSRWEFLRRLAAAEVLIENLEAAWSAYDDGQLSRKDVVPELEKA
ncbi:hypothetical protein [Lentzea sp. NEAU-D7]|uniref:hypothetical protein n=1 Tax=Lentzea sp. NEAU-D7 TaxID=2994667 RepID=UPI00224A7725|nr:hypothetical protein [Lentzea sp. NEAU-D7]MCX2955424.1 hypothetical protein [Lentzea sp. NEAU-D7]